MAIPDRTLGFRTRALHAGTPPDPATGARAQPIYLSSSFVFDSTEHAAELFALRTYGNIYSRIGNPTVAAFEEKMEFAVTLKRLGIGVTFVAPGDPDGIARAIGPDTKAVYTETIGNPAGNVADLEALAAAAHAAGLPLLVDNTFASPFLCRPIEWGADVVVASATKFIGGHGTAIGGIIVESGTFPWGAGRHPLLSTPSPGYHDMSFAETFGEFAFLMRARVEVLRDVGACLSPMNAFLFVQGLETLPLRMPAHVANARIIAEFLQSRDEVAWIAYAGLPGDPSYALARKYLPEGPGSIFSFGLRGGREAGKVFIESLELWSHLANVGDAKSLVIHPASTTHQQLSDADMAAAGVRPELIRVSVGLEDAADLMWDLDRALRRAAAAVRAPA